MDASNAIGEAFSRKLYGKCAFLDQNNLIWQLKDGEWIGKRSVFTKDFKSVWLEETTIDNIRSWWCGKDADYTEIFKRD